VKQLTDHLLGLVDGVDRVRGGDVDRDVLIGLIGREILIVCH
jgi:hypothetical protein